MSKKYDLSLRPVHYACVSGGKDSLYMLGLILNNLDKYPLDCVVHYQLEIDWDWANGVVDRMEEMCNKAGIKFFRITPRISWYELQKKYLFPSRVSRWCNSKYKLDAENQLVKWIESQGCRPIAYIGFCADETKRFKYEIGGGRWQKEIYCYPLAEEGINEDAILEWAKSNPIFNGWYMYFRRQGCKMCPMISMKELAYMSKYEPESFKAYGMYVREYEESLNRPFFKEYWDVIEKRILKKWASILESEEQQYNFFEDIYKESI